MGESLYSSAIKSNQPYALCTKLTEMDADGVVEKVTLEQVAMGSNPTRGLHVIPHSHYYASSVSRHVFMLFSNANNHIFCYLLLLANNNQDNIAN